MPSQAQKRPNKQFYLDANQSSYNTKTKQQTHQGNVIAISKELLIKADKVWIEEPLFHAKGNVLIIENNKIFQGKELTLDINKHTFNLKNAKMLSQGNELNKPMMSKLLGFSKDDINEEVHRITQLQKLRKQRTHLRDLYIQTYSLDERKNLSNQYIALLEQEANTLGLQKHQNRQDNNFYAKKRFLNSLTLNGSNDRFKNDVYFQLQGKDLTKVAEDHFLVQDAKVTPCFCPLDEQPPWSFSVSKIDAKIGGYGDLSNPLLLIKGIPIFYLPFIRIPLKSSRQSGFLAPAIAYDKKSGAIYSQPLYLALSHDKDLTLTTDYLEQRGVRFGAYYRQKLSQQSGFHLKLSGLRDRIWIKQASDRQQVIDSFHDSLLIARDPDSQGNGISSQQPGWWRDHGYSACLTDNECFEREIRNPLSPPGNEWRGAIEWSGRSFLLPRVSFISTGQYLSDHHLLDQIFIPNMEIDSPEAPALLHSSINNAFHIDSSDFYLGISSKLYDFLDLYQNFQGLQKPVDLKFVTRLVPLYVSPILPTVYGRFSFRFSLFRRLVPEHHYQKNPDLFSVKLGNGDWRQMKIDLQSPLLRKQIIKLNLFGEAEERAINYQVLSNFNNGKSQDPLDLSGDYHSKIQTLRFGINLQVPIKGIRLTKNSTKESALIHEMDWGIQLSIRPGVYRTGFYGYQSRQYQKDATKPWASKRSQPALSYFHSDLEDQFRFSQVEDINSMLLHRKLSFSTNHFFHGQDHSWKFKTPITAVDPEYSKREDLKKIAKKDLMDQLEQPLNDMSLLIKGIDEQKYIKTTTAKPYSLRFTAKTGIDFLKLDQRKQALQDLNIQDFELPEPWDPLEATISTNLSNWGVSAKSNYNFYLETFSPITVQLNTPTLLKTKLSFHLRLEKNRYIQNDKTQYFFLQEQQTHLTSQLLPQIQFDGRFSIRMFQDQRLTEGQLKQFSASAMLKYLSPSNCWGLGFAWAKRYEQEWSGTFMLTLAIKFFGHEKQVGNFLERYNVKKSTTT